MFDPAASRFFDVAHEGAFIRSSRRIIDDGLCADIAQLQPRSLVVVAADEMSRAAAHLAVSLAEPLTVPVSVVDQLPRFAGALDVVVVASSKSIARQERDLQQAVQRGCITVLLAPPVGPLREEAPDRAFVVPAPVTAEGSSPAAVIATVFGLISALSSPLTAVAERLDLAAEAVDHELVAASPDRDELVNQAKQLRSFAEGSRIIHVGAAGPAVALARLMAVLWTERGLVSAAMELEEMQVALPNLNPGNDDIFYDPFEDEARTVLPLSTVIWAMREPLLPRALAQHVETDELTLDNILRLLVRGHAAAVY